VKIVQQDSQKVKAARRLLLSLSFRYINYMEKKKFKIIFVCTDNFGRSVCAERCLKDYLAKNQIEGYEVSSAGTNADSNTTGFSFTHFGELQRLGVPDSPLVRTQLTKELAETADIIIAFDLSHLAWIKENLGLDVPLFNEIYKNQKIPISCKEYGDEMTTDEKMIRIADYIHAATPTVFKNIAAKNAN